MMTNFTGRIRRALICILLPASFHSLAQSKAHAFLIASPRPDAKQIQSTYNLKKEAIEFDDLSTPLTEDVKHMRDWLQRSGFKSEDITVFDKNDYTINSVKAAIVAGTKNLPTNALVLFYFTGHGLQIIDDPKGRDKEADGLDETLVFPKELWIDDDVNQFYASNLSKFHNVMIVDACFSGTSYKIFGPLTKREKLVKISPKQFHLSPSTVNAPASCTKFDIEPKDQGFKMLYLGATGDTGKANADNRGSWLTRYLHLISQESYFDKNYTFPDLYCTLWSFADKDDDILVKPTYAEIGDVSSFNKSQPLKVNP